MARAVKDYECDECGMVWGINEIANGKCPDCGEVIVLAALADIENDVQQGAMPSLDLIRAAIAKLTE